MVTVQPVHHLLSIAAKLRVTPSGSTEQHAPGGFNLQAPFVWKVLFCKMQMCSSSGTSTVDDLIRYIIPAINIAGKNTGL